jgi:hypothetical protein
MLQTPILNGIFLPRGEEGNQSLVVPLYAGFTVT